MRALLILLLATTACATTPVLPVHSAPRPDPAAECRPNPHLAQAKVLYDHLEFDRAAARLARAVEYPRTCRADLAEIYRLKAFIDAING